MSFVKKALAVAAGVGLYELAIRPTVLDIASGRRELDDELDDEENLEQLIKDAELELAREQAFAEL
jgi:hypothetical protein